MYKDLKIPVGFLVDFLMFLLIVFFSRDAAILWNNAPYAVTSATKLTTAKKEIKTYSKILET